MNVEIGAEAALFPEKEYINGIFVAVYFTTRNIVSQELINSSFQILKSLYPPSMVEFSDVKAGLLEAWRTAGPVPAQGGLRGQAVGQAHQPPLSL